MALNHFPHVYQPIQVGSMTLKNRIQYSPIVSNHAGYRSGSVTDKLLEFVIGQAKTGAGLVTIGSTPVNFREGRDFYSCLSVTSDEDMGGLTMLSGEVHRFRQQAVGGADPCRPMGPPGPLPKGEQAWVPSVVEPYHNHKRFREITRARHADRHRRLRRGAHAMHELRLRYGNDPLCPRQPDVRLSLHRLEPARRRLRRLRSEPLALSAGASGGGSRHGQGPDSPGNARRGQRTYPRRHTPRRGASAS